MRPLIAVLLLAACLPVHAADQEPPFSYLFLSAAYTRDRDRDRDVISNGYNIGGSVDLSAHSFFSAGYSRAETGTFRVGPAEGEIQDDGYSLGFGAHMSLAPKTDLTSSLSYIVARRQVSDALTGEEDDDRSEGASASIGLRHLLHPWVEASIGPSYSFVAGETGWDVSAGLGFLMTSRVWMDVDYFRNGSGGDSDGWSLGLRTVLGGD